MMCLGYDNFIFIPIAKNGSTTIKKTLLKNFGPQWDMPPQMAKYSAKPKWVMLRNPYERMESTWRFFVKKGDTEDDFSTFVCKWIEEPPRDDVHLRTQKSFLDEVSCEMEAFCWEWERLGARLGVVFPQMNMSPGDKQVWQRYATQKFEEAYDGDIDLWASCVTAGLAEW